MGGALAAKKEHDKETTTICAVLALLITFFRLKCYNSLITCMFFNLFLYLRILSA